MLEIVTAIQRGEATMEMLALLEETAHTVALASLCGLGKTAPNPVLTTLKYFPDEYHAHIVDKRCPAGVCAALSVYRIDPSICTECGTCADACPYEAIVTTDEGGYTIADARCRRCGRCIEVCPSEAIRAGG
jgi:ferredoxin